MRSRFPGGLFLFFFTWISLFGWMSDRSYHAQTVRGSRLGSERSFRPLSGTKPKEDEKRSIIESFKRHVRPELFFDQTSKITADVSQFAQFGESVAVSGNTAVVGARFDNLGANRIGSAYLFERNAGGAGNWGQIKKLTPSDDPEFAVFGTAVAIDGDTAVVNAPDIDAVYIFERNAGGANNWGEVKKLSAAGISATGHRSVALSGDTLVVGGAADNLPGGPVFQGSIYIFERNLGGAGNWGLAKKIFAADGAFQDFFGETVAIDGDTIVAGAPLDDIDANRDEGSVYVFQRDSGGADNWGAD